MKHSITFLTIVFMTFFLFACSSIETPRETGDAVSATIGVTKTFTPFNDASSNVITTSSIASHKVNVSISNSSITNRTVTIAGVNSSGSITSETLNMNGSSVRSSAMNWTTITKISLNASIVGTTTFTDALTGDRIAVIASASTDAYNSVSYNGTNYVVPGVTFNSSDVSVSGTDEYAVYLSCGTISSGSNYSVKYYISPDGYKWFAGAVTLTSCNGTSSSQQLTDKGVSYIRLQMTPGDSLPNQAYAKLVYR